VPNKAVFKAQGVQTPAPRTNIEISPWRQRTVRLIEYTQKGPSTQKSIDQSLKMGGTECGAVISKDPLLEEKKKEVRQCSHVLTNYLRNLGVDGYDWLTVMYQFSFCTTNYSRWLYLCAIGYFCTKTRCKDIYNHHIEGEQ